MIVDESCTFLSKTEVMVSSIVFKETFPTKLGDRMIAVLFQICFNGLGATTNRVARGNQTPWPFQSNYIPGLLKISKAPQKKHIRFSSTSGKHIMMKSASWVRE